MIATSNGGESVIAVNSPAIQQDVPFADYCAWPAMNVSTLVRGFIRDGDRDVFSPPHLKAAIEGRLHKPESKQIDFGHALHCRLLEPERYKRDYVICTRCVARIKSGDRAGAACGNQSTWRALDGQWYCGTHKPEAAEKPAEFVTVEQDYAIERIAHEMRDCKAVKLLRAQGGFEQSFLTLLDGIPVKGRTDKDIPRPPGRFPPAVVDIKTVQGGRFVDSVFFKQARQLHYPEKLAWYCKLLEKEDGIKRIGIWVIVEVQEPHIVSVRQCPPRWLEHGWNKIYGAFRTFAECATKQEWPNLYGDLKELAVPNYFERELIDAPY